MYFLVLVNVTKHHTHTYIYKPPKIGMLTYILLPQKLGGHLPGLQSFISFSVEERVIWTLGGPGKVISF